MTVLQKEKFTTSQKFGNRYENVDEVPEKYLNHPTFGLIYSLCQLEDDQEVFTSIYAKRIFFLVTKNITNTKCEPIGRTDACQLVENRLREYRRFGQSQEFDKLQAIYKQTF